MAATPPSTSEGPATASGPQPPEQHPSRRRALGIGVGAVAAAGLATWVGFRVLDDDASSTQPPAASPTQEPTPTPVVRQEWISGASGDGVADGSYAAARGRDVEVSATWFDNNEAMVELYTLQPGAEFADWQKPLDVAIGGIDTGEGESWADAARGAYEDRWRESLTGLRDLWGSRAATLYIRFAHEMNGDWYDWAVTSDDADDFKTAWARFRALQQEVFPASQLVLCFNRESVGTGMDWRELYPGDGLVDVMGVDYYNQNPAIDTDEAWEQSMTALDRFGGPKGLQGHLDFARSVGLPMVVSEWSGNADQGDHPVFIRRMNEFFAANGGTGAGQLLYEVQFNVGSHGDGQFLLVGDGTRMPESQAEYLSLQW